MWNLKILDFLVEFKFFKILLVTAQRLTKPFFGRLLFLYLFFMMYCQLGSILYGGKITRDSVLDADPNAPAYYWLLNFNDFASGLLTLFQIMVYNNWYLTVDMYCDVMDSEGPKIFFSSFLIIVVYINLNIVTASVIDFYATSEDVVSTKFNLLTNSSILREKFKGMSPQEIQN